MCTAGPPELVQDGPSTPLGLGHFVFPLEDVTNK